MQGGDILVDIGVGGDGIIGMAKNLLDIFRPGGGSGKTGAAG